ncbi:hypothetical protein L3i22_047940 [Actinoplanes sp. L3-i22]|nr:hypothetical protein L3i22_047940 [Actinoplanes sp. L3-i22]
MDAAGVARVAAARAGDRDALDTLLAEHLPLVYNVVGRALDGHPDTDDVVQETMLRAVRDLPGLRAPESFRSWLIAITVRQVGTHRMRRQAARQRGEPLEEAAAAPDPQAEIENVTLLRMRVSGQRQEAAEASRWLDDDDRTVLALWWQETAGLLTRAEVAAALGLSAAHAGVRVQRVREQFDSSRTVVAALAADPVCPELAGLISGWDGVPAPVWRKRLVRHTRDCPICPAADADRIPAERLLAGATALIVPPGLLKSGRTATMTKIIAAVAATAAAVTAAVVVVYQRDPEPLATAAEPPPVAAATAAPGPSASPSASPSPARRAGTIVAGRLSLESARGGYLSARADDVATVVTVGSGSAQRRAATFVAVAGLADPDCFSFHTLDGRYLRHYTLLAFTHAKQDNEQFRQDATFCPRRGAVTDSVRLEAVNFDHQYLRWTGTELRLAYDDGSSGFRTDSTFRVRPARTP